MYHNKHTFMKNVHNYSNLAQSQLLFHMHQQPLISDQVSDPIMKTIHLAITENAQEWLDLLMDRQTDGLTGPIPIFPDSAIALNDYTPVCYFGSMPGSFYVMTVMLLALFIINLVVLCTSPLLIVLYKPAMISCIIVWHMEIKSLAWSTWMEHYL